MPASFLVLTNLSDTGKLAARYAAVLGEPLRVHLALLNLYHNPVLDPDLLTVTAARAYRSQAETLHQLRAVAERLPAPAEVQVAIGTLGEAIADAVHHSAPLLLAMGLSPAQGLLDEVLHNQALPALRTTARPLLLVPEAAPAPRLPQRVLIAVDAEPFALSAAVRQLAPLLGCWPAAFTAVHVRTRREARALAEPGRMALAAVRACGLLPPGTALGLYEEHALAPAAGVLQALANTGADLLILIARPRSFWGRLFHRSITAQVLRRSRVPVLLLPAQAPDLPE